MVTFWNSLGKLSDTALNDKISIAAQGTKDPTPERASI
jgi:hypothetical protein